MNIARSIPMNIKVVDDSKVTIDYLDQAKVGEESNDYVRVDLRGVKGIKLNGVEAIFISLKHVHAEGKWL